MMKKRTVEERLIESTRQAVEIRKGRRKPAREYDLPLTARRAVTENAPEYDKERVAAIRKQMNVSQSVFADALNVSVGTVRSWERGARVPEGAARRLLEVAERSPEVIRGFVRVRSAQR
jgi:DNA-binding transcriptional regulator YiaG